MLVECSPFFSSSTKAKLQDAGVLYMNDLHSIFHNSSTESLQGAIASQTAAEVVKQTFATATKDIDEQGKIRRLLFDEATRTLSGVSLSEVEARDILEGVLQYRAEAERLSSQSGRLHLRSRTLRELREEIASLKGSDGKPLPSHVTTFSRHLDALLGGGIPVGTVSEISGPPGVGKTQLLLQLAVSAVLPVEFGGLDGGCLFVDTEGSFVPYRLEQIATAAVKLARSIVARQRAAALAAQGCDEAVIKEKAVVEALNERKRSVVASTRHTELSSIPEFSLDRAPRRRESLLFPDLDSAAHNRLTSSTTAVSSTPHQEPTRKRERELPQDKTAATEKLLSSLDAIEKRFTVSAVLERVRYIRVVDLATLLAVLYSLPSLLGRVEEAAVSSPNSSKVTLGVESDRSSRNRTSAFDRCSGTHCDDYPARMLLIDSIALPFRSFTGSSCEVGLGDISSSRCASSSVSGGTRPTTRGGLSRHQLWQRSRLLLQCSELLQEAAAHYQMAVVVTNHMTTRWLQPVSSASSLGSTKIVSSAANSSPPKSVLIPALGDSWSYGLATRLLLSFHHYELPYAPYCGGQSGGPSNDRRCQEGIVYCTLPPAAPTTELLGNAISVEDIAPDATLGLNGGGCGATVAQHRVARTLKATARPRGECCFYITSKGIRDMA